MGRDAKKTPTMSHFDPKFDVAYSFVKTHEGGFSDHGNDYGGATKFGISLRTLKTTGLIDGDIDDDGDIDKDDIIALTEPHAREFYYAWWRKFRYYMMPFPIGKKVFDLSVNMGPTRAHKLLQLALRAVDGGQELVIDGKIGAKTRNAYHRANLDQLRAALRVEAAHFYKKLALQKPSQRVFLKGWLARAYDD